MLLTDQLLIVTGASRGLGAAIAEAAHREGAVVVLNYHQSQAAAEALAQRLGTRAMALHADVREADAVHAMVAEAERRSGLKVRGLVNNALINYAFNGDARDRLGAIGWSAMEAQLKGSVQGALNTIQACLPSMRQAGGGRVVNIGTNLFQNPVVPYHDYTAAKAALLSLTRTAAHELGADGITVNMVSGGLLRTTDASAATPEAVFDWIAQQTPLRHVTTPAELADAVVFFLSPLARGVTGQNLVVDGGLVMN